MLILLCEVLAVAIESIIWNSGNVKRDDIRRTTCIDWLAFNEHVLVLYVVEQHAKSE